ncbi:hypothetical protein FRC01_003239 [Tulasnella sp. 417]|nr:hypothetical protein FRC01_003239 [Tulasnella sp. 417]
MNTSPIDDEEPIVPPPFSTPLRNTSTSRDQEPTDASLEELRRWQQQRVERKLRGEYESQVKKLVEVVTENLDQPARIGAIRVEGAHRTRSSFLGSLVTPYFAAPADGSPPKPTTLADVLSTTQEVRSLLQDTQIFTSVKPTLERSWSPLAERDDIDIVFRCTERGKYFIRTATDLGNQEGSASATARINNVFGGAESLEGNLSFGTKTRQAFQLRLEAPVVALDHSLKTRGELSAFSTERDFSTFASVSEAVKGLKFALRTPWRQGSHEVAYELTSRHIGNLAENASLSMREAAGHSFKSGLTHTYLRDTRDDPMFGSQGSYAKIAHEIAGLAGDVSHFKSESVFQVSRQVANGLSLSYSAASGLLYPLSLYASRPPSAQSMFSDRFQLGGPLSVRMFKQNGLGPKDNGDSLGGDLYWSVGVSMFTDVPKKPHWPIKLHAFVNAGRLDALDRSKPIDLVESVKQSLTRPSISAGVGLIYRFDPVRVEVNVGVPLVAGQSDLGRRGVQVGMGLEFL